METSYRTNTRFEILTPKGWKNFDGIKRTKRKTGIKLTTVDKEIVVTPEHKIKQGNNYVSALEYCKSDEIIDCSFVHKEQWFYDPINVEDTHNYIANGFDNHNCEFLGSSGTLIAGWKLKDLIAARSIPIKHGHGTYQYEQAIKGNRYAIVCDVSRGRGLDYSTMQVIDITVMPYKQVCVFRDNLIAPLDFSEAIYRMAKLYNNAVVLVEINDIGSQVSESLFYTFEYENVLMTENAGKAGKRISAGFGSKEKDFGIRTTKTVKATGCAILKLLIEQSKLILTDKFSIDELVTFSRKNNSYEAESGAHDDLVMPLVLFAWLSDQQYFKDFTDINTLQILREKNTDQMMEEMLPFGIIDDGIEETTSFEEPKLVDNLERYLLS